jgi:two-component system alkaline phosphatase synthesis response regulator PhoP
MYLKPGVLVMIKKRILIADDDPSFLQLLAIKAIKEGYDVVGVQDGIELLHKFERDRFDLIITDLMMSHLNGASAVEILKLHGCTIPVVALTAKDHREIHAVTDTFTKIFHKPCSFKDLFSYVKSIIDIETAV